jgi:hypothetical protein
MTTHHLSTITKSGGIFASIALAGISPLLAIDIIDEFDSSTIDPLIWESTGSKTSSVSGGKLIWADNGGDWGAGNITSQQRLFLPPAGQTTIIEWTLGPASITTVNPIDNGKSVRYQIGIHSANEIARVKEHWLNTTGGIWLDLDNITPNDTATASGFCVYSDNTKTSASAGQTLATPTLSWNWQSESKTIRLELTNTEYSWYDGTTLFATQLLSDANIDTEFGNGYRVLAIGMNFNGSRSTTTIEKISILNATGPSALVTSFGTTKLSVTSGQKFNLNWLVAQNANVSIDQGIGNIDAQTTLGAGTLEIIAPPVEFTTTIEYNLMVTDQEETAIRSINVTVNPAPELTLENFFEDFDSPFLDNQTWEYLGDQSYSISNSFLTWAADGSTWSHGEVASVKAYPVPTPGRPTTITWTYGPSNVTVDNVNGTAIRPLMGIFSAFEVHPWSRQHWQNTTGGLWLDLSNMGNTRPDGASGSVFAANDIKPFETDGTNVTGVDIPGWNWQNENHTFSLVLTNTGFTWYDGEVELATGLYADYGLDDEFSAGFKIMAMSGNSNEGRGTMSIDSITVENGAAAGPVEITVTELNYSPSAKTLGLTWTSIADVQYEVDILQPNGTWLNIEDAITASGPLSSVTLRGVTDTSGIYQIRALKR